jgi:hypothetical protein
MKRREFCRSLAALAVGPVAPNVGGLWVASSRAVLEELAASMASGTWALVPPSAGMDQVLFSAGTTQNILIFGGAAPYDPIGKRILIVGCDHGQLAQFVQYGLATHAWTTLLKPSLGLHAYQHLAVDPATGVAYLLAQTADGGADLRRWDGSAWQFLVRFPMNPVTYSSITFWCGKLTWYDSTFGGVYQLESDLAWTNIGKHPTTRGVYQSVSVACGASYVFGGGNIYGQGDNPDGHWAGEKTLYRLTDGTVTAMPDAPFRVGIYNGMLTSGDGKGRVNLLGFGQFWQLDPAAKTMTRLRDPPAGLVDPVRQSVMACAIDALECAVYVQWDRSRTPKAAMYVFKA